MKFSMLQAAKEIGVAQSTMHRYIKSGRVSATRHDDGSYEIDASELHRAFPAGWRKKGETVSEPPVPNDAEPGKTPSGTPAENLSLRTEIRMLREMLERADLDQDRQRREADATISDLRARLDQEGEERRSLNLRLLAYQPAPDVPPPAGPAGTPAATTVGSAAPVRRGLFGLLRKAG